MAITRKPKRSTRPPKYAPFVLRKKPVAPRGGVTVQTPTTEGVDTSINLGDTLHYYSSVLMQQRLYDGGV